jgi:2-polyprenyl-6-methoxyphenol hydroxylase-like FAD-dependent oxidoreductase
VGLEQNDRRATLQFRSAAGAMRAPVTADIAVAADGVNSTVRRHFYPDDALCFGGINSWRGVTHAKPILTGRSYVRIGSIQRGNMVIHPIADESDGRQLINRTAQVAQPGYERNDWKKPGRLEDMLPILDARALADRLAAGGDPVAALSEYEALRSEPTARVVRTNRDQPPDDLIRRVGELVGDQLFDDLDRHITRAKLQRLSEAYKRVTGFARADVEAQ